MEKSFLLPVIFLWFFSFNGFGQDKESKIVVQKFLAHSIQNNKGGEDANRRLTIYLPHGYEQTNQRYPTIYFLHGFASDDTDMMEWFGFKSLMDSAIKSGKMRPMILILPNSVGT